MIRETVPLGSPSDDASIALLADVLARLALIREWLDEQPHGLFRDGDGRPQPILRHVQAWENTAVRLADRLGLNLASRAEIGLSLAGTVALAKRSDLSALTVEELAQLRALTVKARDAALESGEETDARD
jgi:hypothetical protein